MSRLDREKSVISKVSKLFKYGLEYPLEPKTHHKSFNALAIENVVSCPS